MRILVESITPDLQPVMGRIGQALQKDFDKGANSIFSDIVGALATLQRLLAGMYYIITN